MISEQRIHTDHVAEEEAEKQTSLLIEAFKKENPRARR